MAAMDSSSAASGLAPNPPPEGCVFVKLQDHAGVVLVEYADLKYPYVCGLLGRIKNETCQVALSGVDISDLFLLRNGLRLRGDSPVDSITDGNTYDNPFVVEYAHTESAAKRQRTSSPAAAAAPAAQLNLTTEEGRERLVEMLAPRADRFKTCARLDAGSLPFVQTQERKAAFQDLLWTWKGNFEASAQRNKLSLPALAAAPGTGKTRFAWLAATRGRLPGAAAVDEEWRLAMADLPTSDDFKEFKTGIQNAVGVAVTFNCDMEPDEGEEHRYMIGVRMLYGHFCDTKATRFVQFLELLRSHGCHKIDSVTALEIIERDIKVNHPLDRGVKRHVILVVDEPLRALNADAQEKRREQLGALTSSVGQLITDFPHVHVLMTSLSGSDLAEAAKTVSGRIVHFVKFFLLLSKAGVEALVAALEDAVVRLLLQTDRRFRAVLNECLGVPRLLEKVVVAAASPKITDEASCDTVRSIVADLFESHDKYKERQLRHDALVAALFGSWRPSSDARQRKTRAAEREGYLFDGKIPPLLLKWWWCMDDEQHKADEMHALLKAAVGIYTLSEEVGGAEHGPRFERQLAYLWRILTITDAVSRREAGDHRPRTIHGVLGSEQLAGADDAVSRRSLGDVTAAFNKALGEVPVGCLLQPFQELDKPGAGPTDVPAEPLLGTPYFPKDKQNPGFDFVIEEPTTVDGGGVQVLVEARFSGEGATTAPLSQDEIVDKYVKAVRDRPTVRDRLLEGQLCYVIGGLREVQVSVMQDINAVVSAIVRALRESKAAKYRMLHQYVGRSLVLLTRRHTAELLTPTLSSLPPFGDLW